MSKIKIGKKGLKEKLWKNGYPRRTGAKRDEAVENSEECAENCGRIMLAFFKNLNYTKVSGRTPTQTSEKLQK